jgi:hypothetical protein
MLRWNLPQPRGNFVLQPQWLNSDQFIAIHETGGKFTFNNGSLISRKNPELFPYLNNPAQKPARDGRP